MPGTPNWRGELRIVGKTSVVGGPLQTERCSNGQRKLLRDLTVAVTVKDEGTEITVEKGFPTDFSSIPPFCRWVVRWSKVDLAGVVHDWLYADGPLARKPADEIWWQVARAGEHCANPCQAWLCWLALRCFGWRAWKRHAESREDAARELAKKERDADGTIRGVDVDVTGVVAAALQELVEPLFAFVKRLHDDGRVTDREVERLRQEFRAVTATLDDRLKERVHGIPTDENAGGDRG